MTGQAEAVAARLPEAMATTDAEATATAAIKLAGARARVDRKRADLAAWVVPTPALPKGATVAKLAADGADQTAALQKILDTLAPGDTLHIPAGRYPVAGPLAITKPVAIIGEPGTVLDCSASPAAKTYTDAIKINPAGTDRLTGVSITGLEIVGAGVEKYGTLIYANNCDGLTITSCRLRDSGYAGIRINGCIDTLVENCIIDNIYLAGLGYGVAVLQNCNTTVIRSNWFTTRGKHNVAVVAAGTPTEADWSRAITVEDNYSENAIGTAYDAHRYTTGPYTVKNNVVVDSAGLCGLENATAGATITGNVALNMTRGARVTNNKYYPPSTPKSATDTFTDNVIEVITPTMDSIGYPICCFFANGVISNNLLITAGAGPMISMYTGAPASFEVTGNIYANGGIGDTLLNPGNHATRVENNVYLTGGTGA